ncbi:hypothetical protein MPER_08473 [Moniliophthora perniciosa FA553]|nr:hypothetical protein MPER_08473 [Moniliophthora perniciosa FA553]
MIPILSHHKVILIVEVIRLIAGQTPCISCSTSTLIPAANSAIGNATEAAVTAVNTAYAAFCYRVAPAGLLSMTAEAGARESTGGAVGEALLPDAEPEPEAAKRAAEEEDRDDEDAGPWAFGDDGEGEGFHVSRCWGSSSAEDDNNPLGPALIKGGETTAGVYLSGSANSMSLSSLVEVVVGLPVMIVAVAVEVVAVAVVSSRSC